MERSLVLSCLPSLGLGLGRSSYIATHVLCSRSVFFPFWSQPRPHSSSCQLSVVGISVEIGMGMRYSALRCLVLPCFWCTRPSALFPFTFTSLISHPSPISRPHPPCT
ncbi:hypothetical protein L226DRAFT_215001 [Lentinus tigrinus ALCF2SS1-7]|uniref:Uncharacterized protein n=1 Tax=Lentinus tigrinus ALCF2SS1-6 TaxID=1328759 RepID=A0A5C2RZ56_9APHY|nr:hypothetical protein L227DRAFT_284746 [Lentinus tigrinus ALCF2SS1-6]RPD71087.1 hypothetical protein L226DRAFT_215001 [Lentinus tigrinus ALCF2SS1-7]